jgi:hypothetical protein
VTRHIVFGIGLSRTGTSSLTRALNIVGLRAKHFPDDPETIRQLTVGDFALSLFDRGYDAIADTPAAAFFPQYSELFPDAKFVLTIRDRIAWHRSVQSYWARNNHKRDNRPYHRFIDSVVYGTYRYSRERFDYVYDRHIREVQHHFRADPSRLLILDICAGDGWGKLCNFLRCPHPATSFPHANSGHY